MRFFGYDELSCSVKWGADLAVPRIFLHMLPRSELEKTECLVREKKVIPAKMDQCSLPFPKTVCLQTSYSAEDRRTPGSGGRAVDFFAVLFHGLVVFFAFEEHGDFGKTAVRIRVDHVEQRDRLEEQFFAILEKALAASLRQRCLPVVVEETVREAKAVDSSFVKFVCVGGDFVRLQRIRFFKGASPFQTSGSGGIVERGSDFRGSKPRDAPKQQE